MRPAGCPCAALMLAGAQNHLSKRHLPEGLKTKNLITAIKPSKNISKFFNIIPLLNVNIFLILNPYNKNR
jgi:hypothetical protein